MCPDSECWVSEYQQRLILCPVLQAATSAESHSNEHTSGDNPVEEGRRLAVL